MKTAGDPVSFAPTIRREAQAVAAAVPITQTSFLSAQINRSLVKERLMTRILGAFAALALLLASVGLYGVLGYAVTRRTNEIGIRLALGATRGTVLWSVLRESWTLVAIGVAVGVPAALAAHTVSFELALWRDADGPVGAQRSRCVPVRRRVGGRVTARMAGRPRGSTRGLAIRVIDA